MNLFKDILTDKNRVIGIDEYINESDGLIYCKKCGKHKQLILPILGEQHVVRSLCKCEEAEREAKKDEEDRRKELIQVETLRRYGLHDEVLRNYRFENDEGYIEKIDMAKHYVDEFEKMKKEGRGLILWGPMGTGKTFFAGCIANALIDQGISVYMTKFSRILNKLSAAFSDDKNAYIDELCKCDLLIIDDLGGERNTDYSIEQLYNVIDSRYLSGKPMIITTNITVKDFKNPECSDHKRIFDRILERCAAVKIDGVNIREIKMRETQKRIEEVIAKNN